MHGCRFTNAKIRSGNHLVLPFNAPGSTRENRRSSKDSASPPRRRHRKRKQRAASKNKRNIEMAKAGAGVTAERAEDAGHAAAGIHSPARGARNWRPKRSSDTTNKPRVSARTPRDALTDITPLHLSREWNRLLKSGGHHREYQETTPAGAKTVRSIAGRSFVRLRSANRWGLGHQRTR